MVVFLPKVICDLLNCQLNFNGYCNSLQIVFHNSRCLYFSSGVKYETMEKQDTRTKS